MFLVLWVITRATVHRWSAKDALCCNLQQKLDGLTMTRQLLPDLTISQDPVHLSFFLLPFLYSVSPSICLIKGTVFIEGWTHLWVLRQERAIYRLLSARRQSHKLPLWKWFPQQQHFVSPLWQRERYGLKKRLAGCEIRAQEQQIYKSGWDIKSRRMLCLVKVKAGNWIHVWMEFAECPTKNTVT